MFSIVILEEKSSSVKRVIWCDSLRETQEVLETLEPMMDAKYLVSGEANSLTWGGKIYCFHTLESASSILQEDYDIKTANT